MKTRIVSVLLDVLSGLLALGVFVIGDGFFHFAADLRSSVVSAAFLYLCAGFMRGSGGNPWLKSLLVTVPGALVLVLLLWTQLLHAVVAILAFVLILFGFCGVRARHYWIKRSGAAFAFTVLAPLATLTVVALAAFPALAAKMATRTTVAPSPTFEVSKIDGSVVHSTDWRGHVVILDYWATWCPACRREMPELEQLYRHYKNDPNVIFWAIDVQKNDESPERAAAFLQRSGYTLPMAVDRSNSVDHFPSAEFPCLILIDRAGKTRLVHIGYDGSEDFQANLSKEIDALLREPV